MPQRPPASLPPIALLIPVYNRQRKLERLLASLEPELHLLDIVIVDDASNPPLETSRFAHYPIHLIRREKNGGPAAAINSGLRYLYDKEYEFIARVDSDDVVISGRFSRQLDYLRQHLAVGILGTAFTIVDEQGNCLKTSLRVYEDDKIRKLMPIDNILQQTTLMMRAKDMKACGFYDERYYVAGDYEYAWRMLNHTRAANLPGAWMLYEHGHKDSVSQARRHRQAINALKIKLLNFNVFSIYCYLGLFYSLFDLTNTTHYLDRLKRVWFKPPRSIP